MCGNTTIPHSHFTHLPSADSELTSFISDNQHFSAAGQLFEARYDFASSKPVLGVPKENIVMDNDNPRLLRRWLRDSGRGCTHPAGNIRVAEKPWQVRRSHILAADEVTFTVSHLLPCEIDHD